MKIVLQRCHSASVSVENQIVGQIEQGFAVFVGIAREDSPDTVRKAALKIAGLRLFSDADGKFNLALRDIGGKVLLISNFTLCGDARKGNRPSFMGAALPEPAREMFDSLATLLTAQNVEVERGIFGADMRVTVENDGPVTLILEF